MADFQIPPKTYATFQKVWPALRETEGWWNTSHGLGLLTFAASVSKGTPRRLVDGLRKYTDELGHREARMVGISTATAVVAGAYAGISRTKSDAIVKMVADIKKRNRKLRYPRSAVHECLAALILHSDARGRISAEAHQRTHQVYEEMGLLRAWPTSPQDLPLAAALQCRKGTPRELVYTVEAIHRSLERRGYPTSSPMTKRVAFLLYSTMRRPIPITDHFASLDGALTDAGRPLAEQDRDWLAVLCYAPQETEVVERVLFETLEVVDALTPAAAEDERFPVAAAVAFAYLAGRDDEGKEPIELGERRVAMLKRATGAALVCGLEVRSS